MNRFPNQPRVMNKPRVNILIQTGQAGWQARVYRTDNSSKVYETAEYTEQQAACDDAKKWAIRNRYVIGKIYGLSRSTPAGINP